MLLICCCCGGKKKKSKSKGTSEPLPATRGGSVVNAGSEFGGRAVADPLIRARSDGHPEH